MEHDLVLAAASVLTVVVGFFLRDVYARLQVLERNNIAYERDIALLKQEIGQGIQHLNELISQKFTEIERRLGQIDDALTKFKN